MYLNASFDNLETEGDQFLAQKKEKTAKPEFKLKYNPNSKIEFLKLI